WSIDVDRETSSIPHRYDDVAFFNHVPSTFIGSFGFNGRPLPRSKAANTFGPRTSDFALAVWRCPAIMQVL
ncbi:hypothetical protein M0D69_40410, partial [Caballeronia sp. SEWSISQ10-4 2]|uniref:hypothetical protein n=1 Tax=Caballeronia sp. SEWSISQ10-4 2 TaxID=2937438 RepID=UPI00264A8697